MMIYQLKNRPMKKLEYWTIPRSDTRNRCAKCLKVLRKGQISHITSSPGVARYKRKCHKCWSFQQKG